MCFQVTAAQKSLLLLLFSHVTLKTVKLVKKFKYHQIRLLFSV